MVASINDKLARLRSGRAPRVLDLFSGCGGLMLGFQRAGCVSVGGIERDPDAARSYALNFHGGDDLHGRPRDITTLDPRRFIEEVTDPGEASGVDILIGGPPCPAFTRVGRAKLRKVAKDPEAHLKDPRALLYLRYLEFVRVMRPLALLMENVPDVLNFGGRNLGEEIAETLEDLGYRCRYTLLNSAHYGVPQMRERFFLTAVHSSVGAEEVAFPAPTHHLSLPVGYASSRHVALKLIPAGAGAAHRYVERIAIERPARLAVSAQQAIGDLPPFAGTSMRRTVQRLQERLPYQNRGRPSSFAKEMRTWPGFEGRSFLADHVTRALTERDFRLFRNMAEGDDYPEAKELARDLFRLAQLEMRRPRLADYVPPYDESKFPNRWRKMESDKPARTLMAHLGKDTYSHIHYDGVQARTISVREAARLQSFPDGFRFCGSMNSAFRQIGNAVPPLLAFRLGESVLHSLRDTASTPSQENVTVRSTAIGMSLEVAAAI